MAESEVIIPENPPLRLLLAFEKTFPELSPQWILQSPGREMWVAARPGEPDRFTILAPDLEARVVFSLRSARTKTSILNRPLPRWGRYVAGVTLALRGTQYLEMEGLQAVVVGTEPPGPRYEHAVGMAIAALWHQIDDRPCTSDSLLELVERIRRDYVEA